MGYGVTPSKRWVVKRRTLRKNIPKLIMISKHILWILLCVVWASMMAIWGYQYEGSGTGNKSMTPISKIQVINMDKYIQLMTYWGFSLTIISWQMLPVLFYFHSLKMTFEHDKYINFIERYFFIQFLILYFFYLAIIKSFKLRVKLRLVPTRTWATEPWFGLG